MDISEFYEWVEYYSIEPWGSIIDGYRNASISSTIANMGLFAVNPKAIKNNMFTLQQFLVGVKNGTSYNKENIKNKNSPKSSEENDEKLKMARRMRETLMAIARKTK